ncbi:MAG: hypothetical protein ACOX3T_06905 [Bdellovibrionota bacterium]
MTVSLDSLLNSINNLENAISAAEDKLSAGKKIHKYTSRFDSYRRICDMQRRFSEEVFYLKAINNTSEIIRKVELINGLSAMILDDLKSLFIQYENLKNKSKQSFYEHSTYECN